MANNGEIDLIASQEAFRQVDQLISKITEADNKMLALANNALMVNKNIATINTPKGLNEFVENSRNLTIELQKETIATETLKQKQQIINTILGVENLNKEDETDFLIQKMLEGEL